MPLRLNDKNDRVLLHVHLDGAYRLTTIADLAKIRGIALVSDKLEELTDYFVVKTPTDLRGFLSKFPEFLQCVQGNKEAIYRTSFEFIEDCANERVCYVEARFCPHFLAGNGLTPRDVLDTVIAAFNDARDKFSIEWGIILTGIREFASFSNEIITLAKEYQGKGVVAIDAAGDEQLSIDDGGTHPHIVEIFHEAQRCGIHRTVHAGENGPAESVREALDEMHAERIGHGYRVIQDQQLYERVKANQVHLEICPTSSRLTSAVSFDWQEHPLHQFIRDGVNFSINTDDPLLNGFGLNEEYEIVKEVFHLSDEQLMHVNLNAAGSTFLPNEDREELKKHILKVNESLRNQ